MNKTLDTHRSGNTKHMKMLFNTTSFLVLALASSTFAVAAEPASVAQSNSVVTFDMFAPPNTNGSSFVGLSGDGSSLLVNNYDLSAGRWVPYVWRNSEGSALVATQDVQARAINYDGSVYVGSTMSSEVTHAARITASGMEDLGTLGGTYAVAIGVSDDGSALTGASYLTGNAAVHAFYWSTSTNSLLDIGTLGGIQSLGMAISGDGTTVVGQSSLNSGEVHAFRWPVNGQMTDLGVLDGDDSSQAVAVSRNGSVVAGYSSSSEEETSRVFRWTQAGNMVDIGTLDTGNPNDSKNINFGALSRDGNTIVGYVSVSPESGGYYERAYRWHAGNDGVTGAMEQLGTLGGRYNRAYAVSADGNVIVGQASTASIGNDNPEKFHGFRWTAATNTITVDDWLRNNGVTLASDVTRTAVAVSSDGSVVAGTTYDGKFYYARVKPAETGSTDPGSTGTGSTDTGSAGTGSTGTGSTGTGSGGTGIMLVDQFVPTVQSAAILPSNTQLNYANTAMFGAEGSPMRNLLNAGQRSAWGTVDSGYDKSHTADGGFALGEFGLGYGIADGVTGRLAIGGTYTKQDLTGGGDFNFKGFYVSPEVSANIGGNFYVTLGGYYALGKIDIHRGYLNGSSIDFSDGNTDTQTWGGKLRLDWLNAATIADTAITPYIGLSRANTTVDAYTENGGSFPVSYDEMNDHATIARLGADYVHPITENVNLLARTEVAHRFENRSSAASAEIIGLSSVDLPGQNLKQWWVRGGLGTEFAVSGGTASLMVNASTEGGDPRVWLRSGWKVNF
ncbi:autotransporter domain-containing protein [Rhizobium sp. P44RR-XXIV]|uniref:autotransporter domain-containing protein n=1 Tax=Rhizobium sp. P44RR-XXIV TaxID=1921145 RepID=UPI00145BB9DE|nr:autotransporter domain-containing protein [Rhizobium sp. P44RR-XXIV]